MTRAAAFGMRDQTRAVLILVAGALLIGSAAFVPILRRYSAAILSSRTLRLRLSDADAAKIVDTHRFVLIGGPHRGGTTLLWRLLAAHPDISGFAETGSATNFGEGSTSNTKPG